MNKSSSGMVPPDRVLARYREILGPGEVLALEALFALRSGMQSVDTRLARWLGDDALSPGRLQVLAVLWSSDRPRSHREIADELRVSRATVTGLVQMLLQVGHVATTPDESDRRKVLVALTAAGRVLTERLIRDNAARLRTAFRALTDDEIRTLAQLLGRLAPVEEGEAGADR